MHKLANGSLVMVELVVALVTGGVPSGAASSLLRMVCADEGLGFGLAARVLRKDAKEQTDLPSEKVHPGVDLATNAAHLHGESNRSSSRSWPNHTGDG